jgi:hypothetical protein
MSTNITVQKVFEFCGRNSQPKHCSPGTAPSSVSLECLDKSEIIRKCLDSRSALNKAEQEIEVYKELLLARTKQYELLKTRIPDVNESEYNKSWSWINKIVLVLKKIDRPLLSSKIIDFITPYELVSQHSHHKAQAFFG